MFYGFEETTKDEDNAAIAVRDIYVKGMKVPNPKNMIDAYRVGKKEAGKTRPVRVEFAYPGDVKFALMSAHKLKAVYPAVYLGPDRSKSERQAHNKLVTQMKELIKQDPNKHYYIRDNKICHIDKTLSRG